MNSVNKIPEQLLKWWEGFKPVEWDINQHLKNPTVNCKTDREKELALYVAEIMKRVKCPIPLSEWPEWAKWAAMDINESWHFYEYEPDRRKNVWSKMFYESSIFKGSDFHWTETLTHRSELENIQP
jgi:hypothetical protein